MVSKSLSLVAAAALALCAGVSQAALTKDIAVNGSFSSGLTGWTEFGAGGTISAATGAAVIDQSNPPPGFGAALGIKNANIGIGVVQALQEVTIKFDVKGSYDVGGVVFAEFFSELAGGGVSKSELLGGAPLFATSQCAGFNANTFTTCTFTTTTGADVAGGVTLQLLGATGGAPGSSSLTTFDNVSVTVAVPEPSTYALMLAGLVGVGVIARRRRSV